MKQLRVYCQKALPLVYIVLSSSWAVIFARKVEWWPRNHFIGKLIGNFWGLTIGLMVIGLVVGFIRWSLGAARPTKVIDIGFLVALSMVPANMLLVIVVGASAGFAPPILIPLVLGPAIAFGWVLGLRSYRADLEVWQLAAQAKSSENRTGTDLQSTDVIKSKVEPNLQVHRQMRIAYKTLQFVLGTLFPFPHTIFILWVASWYRGPLGPMNELGRVTFVDPQAAINHRAAMFLVILGLAISMAISCQKNYRWFAIGFAVSTSILGLLVYNLK